MEYHDTAVELLQAHQCHKASPVANCAVESVLLLQNIHNGGGLSDKHFRIKPSTNLVAPAEIGALVERFLRTVRGELQVYGVVFAATPESVGVGSGDAVEGRAKDL
jgi:hypothetical protein